LFFVEVSAVANAFQDIMEDDADLVKLWIKEMKRVNFTKMRA